MRSTSETGATVADGAVDLVVTVPGASSATAITVLGRIVTMPCSPTNPERVMSLPPKTLCSTTSPPSAIPSPLAFASTPRPVSAERAPARSRPSGDAGRST